MKTIPFARYVVVTLVAMTALALLSGCTLVNSSIVAVVENQPYHKAGATQAQITEDRFACDREIGSKSIWVEIYDSEKEAACMRTKGYTVEGDTNG